MWNTGPSSGIDAGCGGGSLGNKGDRKQSEAGISYGSNSQGNNLHLVGLSIKSNKESQIESRGTGLEYSQIQMKWSNEYAIY